MRIIIATIIMAAAVFGIGCERRPAAVASPDPGTIVNLCFRAAADNVPAGNAALTYNVYAVPADKWLIVTNVYVSEGPSEIRDGRTSTTGLFELPAGGGAEVRKLMGPGPAGYASTVGLKFAPGSTVVSHGPWLDFQLTGYLVAK